MFLSILRLNLEQLMKILLTCQQYFKINAMDEIFRILSKGI